MQNDHLNKCIARITKMYLSNPIQKNIKKEERYHRLVLIRLLYLVYFTDWYFCSKASNEIKKTIVYCLINCVEVIQQVWRTYRLKSETCVNCKMSLKYGEK